MGSSLSGNDDHDIFALIDLGNRNNEFRRNGIGNAFQTGDQFLELIGIEAHLALACDAAADKFLNAVNGAACKFPRKSAVFHAGRVPFQNYGVTR